MENYSQNIFVTIDEDRLIVVFIPRLLDRLDTRRAGNAFQKKNAAVMEMMGYFIIDEPENFNVIEEMSTLERKALGDAWLAELGTPAKITREFEDRVKVCLSTAVDPYEQRIDELLLNRHGDWQAKYYSRGFPVCGRAAAQRVELSAWRGYIALPPSWPPLVTRFRLR
jgi:hypothetical protein